MHVSNYAVHTRLDAKPDLVAKYAAKPGADESPNRPVLAAMLESVDAQVGPDRRDPRAARASPTTRCWW